MRRLIWTTGLLAASFALAGCYKPLFPADSPRTQFENYEKIRGQYIPLEEPDVFGNPQPALRLRLAPTY